MRTCSSRKTRIASAAAAAAAVRGGGAVGENPPGGVVVQYWLKDRPQGEVTLEFLDGTGKLVHEVLQPRSEASSRRSGCAKRRRIRSAAQRRPARARRSPD